MPTKIDGKVPTSIPARVQEKMKAGEPNRLAMSTGMTAAGAVKVRVKP